MAYHEIGDGTQPTCAKRRRRRTSSSRRSTNNPTGLALSDFEENEYLCHTLARELGLPAASAEMATCGDKRVLIVERFDRFTRPYMVA